MTVFGEITYVFYMPQDYDELQLFEAENDLSLYKQKIDTIAVRYTYKTNATYPYKSKADRKTEPSEHRDCINCEDASDCAKCRRFEDEPQTDCPWK